MGAQLKALLAGKRVLRVFALGHLFSPKLVEMIGWRGGFDAVWFDQEHAGLSMAQIEEGSRAARSVGLDCFVRLNATDYATVMRALEAGAGGVMASMVKSAGQAEEIMSWAKFHPRGGRGVNGTGADGRYGATPGAEYFRRANAETVVAVQIEHRDAVEDVERIAAVPDLDFLFIGPADLSQSMGIPGEWEHPRMWAAVERTARAAAANGVAWAILPRDAAHARRCVDLGCRILSIGMDAWAFQKGIAAVQQDFAEFFGAPPA
ncbi:MAG TPA: aldolase/citrate lyase family protein [Gemmataceae bacterium]|nr:aldolase/citrate lyase family protein [Gemmataceae bacterium]